MLASPQPKSNITPKSEPLQMKGPGCHCAETAASEEQKCLACGGPVQRKARPSFDMGRVATQSEAITMPAAARLPSPLQESLEHRSGQDLDDVRVYRNSPEPEKFGAWAFTKGNQIHLGPGQEKHLTHEAWHTVQQKQGRVKATDALFGIPVNDQTSLEAEADQVAANPSAAVSPNMSPDQAASSADGGVMQGVFMKDDGATPYTDIELRAAARKLRMSKSQIAEMMRIQRYKFWRYLGNWLEGEGLARLEQDQPEPTLKRKRKRSPSPAESESDGDSASSSEDESRKPSPRKRTDRKKSPARRRGRSFGDNLGFQPTPAADISKRLYFPAPSLDLTPSLPKPQRRGANAKVSFAPTMTRLEQDAHKPGFRGNIVEAKFEIFYRQNGTTTFSRAPLAMPGVPQEFQSADLLSKAKTTEAYQRINEMQRIIGMKTGQPVGTTVHSERNMILQLDDMQIDDKLVAEIRKFARGKNITVIRAVLLVYSEPNEVCGNCDRALRALSTATKIQAMAGRLTALGVTVDPSFGLLVQTGARQLNTVRKFTSPFSGKPAEIPPIMHTFPPPT